MKRPGTETQVMTTAEVHRALESVTHAVCEIDQECRTLLGGVEHGLANVKLEFRDRAFRETNMKLTEERLIAWLVKEKLGGAGWCVEWESPYPGSRRKKCDLVLHFSEVGLLWLELKMAWKAWFNCECEPTYTNSCYLSYLQGKNHTHSFRHDFEKLGGANCPQGDYRAVCLVGFDSVEAPMDAEVAAVVQGVRREGTPWEVAIERHWPDRRCHAFRINVWNWLLPSQT